VKIGAHLPLADLGDGTPTGQDLRAYAGNAMELGYATMSANDHLVWGSPGSGAAPASPSSSPRRAT
jgi:hypothetical protein